MKKMIQLLIGLAAGGFLALPSVRAQASYTTPYTFITIAGTALGNGGRDGTNGAAQFYWPEGITVDTNGNLYVVDNFENTIRKVAPVGTNWVATTIAGTTNNSGSADGTNGAAWFNEPTGIALDGSGNLYVADGGNNTIRKLTPVGTNWVVTTIAGTAGNIGSADGTNQAASFYYPSGVAVDTNGNVFVADASNDTIREVTPVGTNWVVTTIAGTAGVNSSGDGTNGAAQFSGPSGLALDGAGNLYVADTSNDTIRKLTPVGTNWVVTTIAGQAGNSSSADGAGLGARFNFPIGIAADTNGSLYVADTYNHTIRIIAPAGTNWVVSTLAGVPGSPGGSDGIIWQALFNYPQCLTVDGTGRVFVGDTINGTIRMGLLTPVPDLVISPAVPDGVVVSWPGADVFTLQTNADLTTINWVNYGGIPVAGNGTNSVTLAPAAGQLFFRLSINP